MSRYLWGGIAPLRAWLFVRLLHGLLAFDLWLLMAPRGGKYGAGDFNVAHFDWLAALQPAPSAELYLVLTLSVGLGCLVVALGAAGIVLRTAIAVGYTWSWAMSELDSYQHHYLLSLLIACSLLMPRDPFGLVRRLRHPDGAVPPAVAPRVAAPGVTVACVVVAIAYTFAGITKLEGPWWDGSALAMLARQGDAAAWLEAVAAHVGMPPETLWPFLARATVALEWLLALAWLVAPLRDGAPGRALAWVGLGACALAIPFHVGTELLGLRTGWFAWYMIDLTLVMHAPMRPLERALSAGRRRLLGTWRRLPAHLADLAARPGTSVAAAGGAILAAFFALAIVAGLEDVPGLATVVTVAVVALVAGALFAGHRIVRHGVAWFVAVAALFLSLSLSDFRFDFHRLVAGDLQRRGHPAHALMHYEIAERHAPAGKSRAGRITSLRRVLEEDDGEGEDP
jgi:hypothetical protein